MRQLNLVLVTALFFLTACSVNPVTGKRELVFVSSAQEIQMGKQNYAPMQQSQGGSYDVDPALTQYVQRIGNSVASQSGVALPYEFVVLNNSVPNAWALPGGKIAINRGLLTELRSEAELAAVLGHEAVHAAARHTAKQQSRGMLMQGGVLVAAIATKDSDYGNLAVGGANLVAQLGLSKYGRNAELESDFYGMQYMSKVGYDPQGAVALQETFVRLSEGRNSDWLSGLFASHPPSMERVRKNIATASTLPSGGRLGVDEYQSAIRETMRVKPAYDAYDKGRKALSEKNIDEALSLANQALTLYNEEAHFHALRGDVRLVAEKYAMAITNYNRAINRRGDFFYYHLQRGLTKKELGQTDAAVTDLNRSIELLPTAPAHFALGNIAADRGDRTLAIKHYQVVAKAGGEYGKAGTDKLVKLELPTNPGAYVKLVGCQADASGKLVAGVRNDTNEQITGVQIVVEYGDSAGQTQQRQFNIDGQVPPGRVATVNTGLGPYQPGVRCRAQVIAARIVD